MEQESIDCLSRNQNPRDSVGTNIREPFKTLACGILYILGALWFMYMMLGGPLNELALIRQGEITVGSLVATYEDEQEDSRGQVHFSDIGVYAFSVPDGRKFQATSRVPTGQLKKREKIEYLLNDPTVSRIKGDGCQSTVEWLCRKVLLGGIFFAVLISPGVALIRSAVHKLKRSAGRSTRPTRSKWSTGKYSIE